MSVALMSLAFKTRLPSTQKLVLLALCDAANDLGECYPSVPHLVDKCSLSERAIQDAIAKLEEAGHLGREFRTGRATVYRCHPDQQPPQQAHPRSRRTPAPTAPTPAPAAPPPPQQAHPTPAAPAPRSITEPSVESSLKRDSGSAQAQTPPDFLGDANLAAISGRAVVAIAVDFELPLDWGVDAEALGWLPKEIVRESEKFRQYWVSGKGKGQRRSVKGWRQSWSNWLANAERYKK